MVGVKYPYAWVHLYQALRGGGSGVATAEDLVSSKNQRWKQFSVKLKHALMQCIFSNLRWDGSLRLTCCRPV